jgi:hypothetical protein
MLATRRALLRGFCILLAVAQTVVERNAMDPDGIAYLDVARALLRRDWHNGFNSYWSPLYSWLIACLFGTFHPGIRWQIPLVHAINLAGFLAALAAWEFLVREWEQFAGPPANRTVTDFGSYGIFVWALLHVNGLSFTSADIFVAALLLALAAQLIRVHRGVAGTADYVRIGLTMAFGFFAKAAFSVVIPVVVLELAILLRSWRDRRIWIAAAVALGVMAPFVTVLSVVKGRFMLSDSGSLNYAWEVTGISIPGYKDGQYPAQPALAHPVKKVLDFPEVFSYQDHITGTTPIHADPSWWSEGTQLHFDRKRQLMILSSNLKFCGALLAGSPGIWLLVVAACFSWNSVRRRVTALWFLWLPALCSVGAYCLVYLMGRYVAGSFALLSFAGLAAAWNLRLPARVTPVIVPALAMACFFTLWRESIVMPVAALYSMSGTIRLYGAGAVPAAERLRSAGLREGDKVAFLGNDLNCAWLALDGAHVVVTIPASIVHDDELPGRALRSTFERTDAYWASDAAAQTRAANTFRSAGAKWIFATDVPRWANTSKWSSAGEVNQMRPEDLTQLWFQKLD